jgi:hypothetical protein
VVFVVIAIIWQQIHLVHPANDNDGTTAAFHLAGNPPAAATAAAIVVVVWMSFSHL